MRHEPTFNERRLWRLLRDRRLDDLKFRRQVPLGPHIVDFVCFSRRLVVEADGPFHEQSASDPVRDQRLRHQGFQVLRCANEKITMQPEAVRDEICRRAGLAAQVPSSGPSGHLLPQGEKEI